MEREGIRRIDLFNYSFGITREEATVTHNFGASPLTVTLEWDISGILEIRSEEPKSSRSLDGSSVGRKEPFSVLHL